jgi:exopolysaccharide biosynthesis WecB/TagA/CpsF family protein
MKNTLIERIATSNALPSAGLVTFVNPFSYLKLRNAPDIRKFTAVFPDGISVVWLLKMFGYKLERRSFDTTSLAPIFFTNSIANKYSVAIIGSTSDSMGKFRNILLKTYPTLNLTYSRNGYMAAGEERQNVLAELVKLNPDVVVCGMGSGAQERFLLDLVGLGWTGLGITCGGYFHQTASKGLDYYPSSINKSNLRWAYRIFDEPKLLWRYFILYPIGLSLIFFDAFVLRVKSMLGGI